MAVWRQGPRSGFLEKILVEGWIVLLSPKLLRLTFIVGECVLL